MAICGVHYAAVIVAAIAVTNLPQTRSADPDPLQDFCVADKTSKLFLNGVACIDPTTVVPPQFKTSALGAAGNTRANPWGFNVTLTTTKNLPGVNTQGLALARTDLAAGGLVPPHIHPRASEVTFVIRGNLLVGFVDTANRLFYQKLNAGDAFVFPRAQVHFLYNVGKTSALTISALNSQNPGALIIPRVTFSSKPRIPAAVLAKAFQISAQEFDRISKNLGG